MENDAENNNIITYNLASYQMILVERIESNLFITAKVALSSNNWLHRNAKSETFGFRL